MTPWVPMFVILAPPALFWEAVWPLVVGFYLKKMLIKGSTYRPVLISIDACFLAP